MTREILIEAWKLRYPQMDAEKEVDALLGFLPAAGLVIVPREPTDVMLEAAYQAQIDEANYKPWPTDPSGAEYVSEWVCASIAYRAMVSAAEGNNERSDCNQIATDLGERRMTQANEVRKANDTFDALKSHVATVRASGAKEITLPLELIEHMVETLHNLTVTLAALHWDEEVSGRAN